jgi:ZIP family zinc transporter
LDANIAFALLLPTLAGLSTTLGSLVAIFFRKPGPRFMSMAMGFSAGVMILVSFVELLQGGIEAIGFAPAHMAFFGGMVLMFLIDAFVPHHYIAERHGLAHGTPNSRLLKTGLFVALGTGIHNFPEGIATFMGALKNPSLGIAIAIAIGLHNVPEGIAVSAPIYGATGSRRKAFMWSFLSGVAEPIGAVLAAAILTPFLSEAALGIALATVAGIMAFIALDELVPAACSLGEDHLPIVGVVLGMMVMAVSLWMLR